MASLQVKTFMDTAEVLHVAGVSFLVPLGLFVWNTGLILQVTCILPNTPKKILIYQYAFNVYNNYVYMLLCLSIRLNLADWTK